MFEGKLGSKILKLCLGVDSQVTDLICVCALVENVCALECSRERANLPFLFSFTNSIADFRVKRNKPQRARRIVCYVEYINPFSLNGAHRKYDILSNVYSNYNDNKIIIESYRLYIACAMYIRSYNIARALT